MRNIWSVVVVLLLTVTSYAQPGNPSGPPPPPPDPAGPPPPYAAPPYAAPPYAPPPYAGPHVQLTLDEQELLSKGEISDGAHLGGGVVSLMFGFGVGQAVQGRWGDTGWIFTLGEGAAITAFIVGLASIADCLDSDANCDEDDDGATALLVGGGLGLVAFRIWEVVDAFTGPASHNRRVRELRMRAGVPPPMYTRIAPYVDKPKHGNGGGVVGLSLRF